MGQYHSGSSEEQQQRFYSCCMSKRHRNKVVYHQQLHKQMNKNQPNPKQAKDNLYVDHQKPQERNTQKGLSRMNQIQKFYSQENQIIKDEKLKTNFGENLQIQSKIKKAPPECKKAPLLMTGNDRDNKTIHEETENSHLHSAKFNDQEIVEKCSTKQNSLASNGFSVKKGSLQSKNTSLAKKIQKIKGKYSEETPHIPQKQKQPRIQIVAKDVVPEDRFEEVQKKLRQSSDIVFVNSSIIEVVQQKKEKEQQVVQFFSESSYSTISDKEDQRDKDKGKNHKVGSLKNISQEDQDSIKEKNAEVSSNSPKISYFHLDLKQGSFQNKGNQAQNGLTSQYCKKNRKFQLVSDKTGSESKKYSNKQNLHEKELISNKQTAQRNSFRQRQYRAKAPKQSKVIAF